MRFKIYDLGLKIFFVLLLTTFYITLTVPVFAQAKSIDVTYAYSNVESAAVDGDILKADEGGGLTRISAPYSNQIFGVLQQNSVLVYQDSNSPGEPVARSGIANVNVTTVNGNIKKGDYITTSAIPGKGQKATESGYVLGIALDDFSDTSSEGGKIAVALRVEFAEIRTARYFNRLIDYINAAIFETLQQPDKFIQLVRYLTAATIMLIAFTISFLTFSRAITKGVEGIGRNPLARNAIQFSIIVSAALTTIIALVGVIASFIILRL